jgi:hypothetical protein
MAPIRTIHLFELSKLSSHKPKNNFKFYKYDSDYRDNIKKNKSKYKTKQHLESSPSLSLCVINCRCELLLSCPLLLWALSLCCYGSWVTRTTVQLRKQNLPPDFSCKYLVDSSGKETMKDRFTHSGYLPLFVTAWHPKA